MFQGTEDKKESNIQSNATNKSITPAKNSITPATYQNELKPHSSLANFPKGINRKQRETTIEKVSLGGSAEKPLDEMKPSNDDNYDYIFPNVVKRETIQCRVPTPNDFDEAMQKVKKPEEVAKLVEILSDSN